MGRADSARHKDVSRFLSRVLRHEPQSIGLALDAQGWAEIDELVERARAHGLRLTRDLILRVAERSDKQRFACDGAGRVSGGYRWPGRVPRWQHARQHRYEHWRGLQHGAEPGAHHQSGCWRSMACRVRWRWCYVPGGHLHYSGPLAGSAGL